MKNKQTLQKLLDKQKEITSSPTPNEVGIFTPLYRQVIIFFKIAPYRWLVPLAFILALGLYFLLKINLVRLVTLLQHGF